MQYTVYGDAAQPRSAPDRGWRCSLRPVTASVDMTSTVKGHVHARIVGAIRLLGRCFLVSWWLLEPPEETDPVTATVDHADIRGLGTTFYEGRLVKPLCK